MDDILDQLPFEPTLVNMIVYEASGKPITLKNGAKFYPQGFVRWAKCEEWAKDFRERCG